MKIATSIARILLGLVFLIFGANGFLHFIPNMPMPSAAMQFFGGLAATGYMLPLLFATQALGGVLLILGLFVPLALAMLAPVIVNIFLFHVFLAPSGLPVAIIVVALELFLVWAHREAFAPMLRARMEPADESRAASTRAAAAS
jgi:uncharacterized membrane protein YphA (DoxX/SURF4 family)